MQNIARRLPVVSLILAVAPLPFGFLLGPVLFQQMGNAGTELSLFLAIGSAMAAVLLGVVGFVATRGEGFMRRAPAVLGIALGGILALFDALILFIHLTPTAPF